MENKILNMEMTNFQPEGPDIAIFTKSACQNWSNCIYIAITFEIVIQNRYKFYFWIALVMSFPKIQISFHSSEVRNLT